MGVAVGLAALAQLAFGYLALLRVREETVRRELLLFAQTLYQALDLEGALPSLRAEGHALLLPFGEGRARLVKEGRVYLQYGGLFPEEEPGWVRSGWSLPEGYTLEVALPAPELGYVLGASLFAFPLALALALGTTFFLLRRLLGPLADLARAAEALSQERFPAPVPVPPGRDEVSSLAESFNRMVRAVRGFLERERTFARHAAHELRTPVAALKGQLEALERGLLPLERVLPRLKAQVERLEALLEGLLALARGEVEREQVALRALVQEVASAWPGVVLRLEGKGVVLGPRELLRRALANLLENAFTHGRPPVEVRLWEEGAWVGVEVRDHGPGVPPGLLPHLGTPFLRSAPRGTGLGLALVHRTVDALGGRFFAEDARPGLRVVLLLPKEGP
ncbi:HAMP domain-containing sensor histidine kinase [Thermus sp. FJN-A]